MELFHSSFFCTLTLITIYNTLTISTITPARPKLNNFEPKISSLAQLTVLSDRNANIVLRSVLRAMVIFYFFEKFVPLLKIIVVLLQAYGLIISTSVCMFHIHAHQCLHRGTLSSACKMGEQAVWAFTMDDRYSLVRTGDTICRADGVRLPCCWRQSWGCR